MYTVVKRLEISSAHKLELDYASKCKNLHGHNWIIEVTCRSKTLNNAGMVVDFTKIKDIVSSLDHTYLNNIMVGKNPTAENIAKYLCDLIPNCVAVKIQESEGNTVIYER